MKTDENMLILTDEEMRKNSSSFIDAKEKTRKVYDFKNIHNINDFYLLMGNQSVYLKNSLSNNNVNNASNLNASQSQQLLNSFQKNISTFLVMKKYSSSFNSKYDQLRKEYEKYQRKIPTIRELSNIDDNSFEILDLKSNLKLNLSSIIKENSLEKIKNEKIELKTNRNEEEDIQKVTQILSLNKYNYGQKKLNHSKIDMQIDVDVMIDIGKGIYKKQKRRISLQKVQEKLINIKMGFINDQKYSDEYITKSLSSQFENIIKITKKRPFKIKLPHFHRPQMRDYDDFYSYDRNVARSLSVSSVEESEIENVIIDNMIQETNEPSLILNSELQDTPIKTEEDDQQNLDDKNNQDVGIKHSTGKKREKTHFTSSSSKRKRSIEKKQKQTKQSTAERENPFVEENNKNDENSETKKEFPLVENRQPKEINNPYMPIIERLLNSTDLFKEDLDELKPKDIVYPTFHQSEYKDEKDKKMIEALLNWSCEVEYQIKKDKKDIRKYEKKLKNLLANHPEKSNDGESETNEENDSNDSSNASAPPSEEESPTPEVKNTENQEKTVEEN